ncbi:MAG: hypothetical protein KJ990_06895 [Proteobacteria bacterium]|nr:hypothetical protein [Pseudomonadota bacterium]MBU1650197.1 hypothetical protein [Pseudomonadota bacterium]
MDLASIGSLLGSLKTATEIAKFIRESDTSLEKAETKLKLAELVSALADAKLEAAEIQQLIIDRDETIRQLTAEAKLKAELKWIQPCYYLSNSDGQEEPYCQNCYDSKQKLSRLHTDGKGFFECRVCTQNYKTTERLNRESEEFSRNVKRGNGFF